MLILVAVTINLAADGGLFEKARTASKDTEQKKILEELISMAEFNNDGKIDVDNLKAKVIGKYEGSSYDGTTSKLTVKGNKGDFNYKVTETEITIWKENSEIEEYIVGEYRDLLNSTNFLKINNNNTLVYEEEQEPMQYYYNKDTQIIEYIDSWEKVSVKFKIHIIKDENGYVINKVILPAILEEEGMHSLLTTNGAAGFNNYEIKNDVTYINDETGYFLKFGTASDSKGNVYGTIDMGDHLVYLKIGEYIYTSCRYI